MNTRTIFDETVQQRATTQCPSPEIRAPILQGTWNVHTVVVVVKLANFRVVLSLIW
jgi:hypothetical protein